MIRSSLLAVASLLALSPLAHADKVWLKSTGQRTPTEGEAADFLVGKVLAEDNATLTVRVEGGTVVLQKSTVAKVDKDDLTVATIETKEKESQQVVAAATAQRQKDVAQWADAAAKREQEIAEDRSRQESIVVTVDFKGLIPDAVFRYYDPILHRVDMDGLARAVETYLRAEIERINPRHVAPPQRR